MKLIVNKFLIVATLIFGTFLPGYAASVESNDAINPNK